MEGVNILRYTVSTYVNNSVSPCTTIISNKTLKINRVLGHFSQYKYPVSTRRTPKGSNTSRPNRCLI
jgi:hypothetical protein